MTADEIASMIGISSVVALLSRYVPAYLGEKGKNLATKEDIADITRKVEAVKAEYATELEAARDALRRQSAVETFARDLLSGAHCAAVERRLGAIEALWEEVCDRSRTNHPIFLFADILTRQELAGKKPAGFAKLVDGLTEADLAQRVQKPQFEKHRLYCGDSLWAIYYVATWLPGRILAFYLMQSKGRESSPAWMDDPPIHEVVSQVLEPHEMKEFLDRKISCLTWLQALLQRKFLKIATDLISGKATALLGVEDARYLAAVTAAEASSKALQQAVGSAARC